MKTTFQFLFVSVAMLVANSSCTTTKETASTKDNSATQNISSLGKDDPQMIAAQEKFIEANKMQMLGDWQQALNLYKECVKLDPTNDAAYYNVAKILHSQQRYIDALDFAHEAYRIDPNNKWYADEYGTLAGGTGNFKEAIRVYQQLTQQEPDDVDAWFNYSYFLEQNKQYDDAIAVLNKVEDRYGVDEDISKQKELLWLKLGKIDKAAEELQKLIDANPNEAQYYSMLVDLYMSNKMEDKALAVMEEMIKVDPSDPKANLVLADYYQKKGDEDKAFNYYKQAFSSPDLDIDIEVPILMSYLPSIQKDETKKSEALQLADEISKAHPDEAKAFSIYGDIYNQLNRDQPAIDEYKKALAIDNSKFVVWQQVMYLYMKTDQTDSLYAVSNRAKELFPDQYLVYYFFGAASMQLKKYHDAIEAFGKAIQIGSDDKKMIAQMYTNMGDSYSCMKKYSSGDSCYDLALLFDPNSAYVLNNYSYYLSVRGQRLDDAKTMIEKAIVSAPDEGAYEDTYAWILFKMANYADAKTWEEKAMQHGGAEDGTILEHYGDILYQLGNKDSAVQYWIKAKAQHVESETIDKKIAERKLYE